MLCLGKAGIDGVDHGGQAAVPRCPLLQYGRLEAAFEVRVHLGLGQGAESVGGRYVRVRLHRKAPL